MDAFFSGLGHRLRVSGKVADSIMMGIVNSAMEGAYKKSLSKEGDLERLNEKSRFCELAIMQLEWCLKFVQDEMDGSVVDDARDSEQLLADLLETRDRIQCRLEETEITITEKDRELTRRKENEAKLRLALEVKGEEVSSLLTALGLERVKDERASEPVPCSTMGTQKDEFHMFDELKNSVGLQMQKLSSKLENGRQILTSLMQKRGGNSSDVERFVSGLDVDGDGMKMLPDLYNMAQLLMEFEEMIIDAGVLKESIDSSFEIMGSSVAFFKTTMEEQQWVSSAEKEISGIVITNFLRDLCRSTGFPANCSVPFLLDHNWFSLIDNIATLQAELGVLVSNIDMQIRTPHNSLSKILLGRNSGLEGNTSVGDKLLLNNFGDGAGAIDNQGLGTHFKKVDHMEDLGKENPSGNESVERTTEEINWLKDKLSKEKIYSSQKDENLNALKEAVALIIKRMDAIKTENAELFEAYLEHNSEGSESVERETKILQLPREAHKWLENKKCRRLVDAQLIEEIRHLMEEKDDLNTISRLMEETYTILFKGLVRTQCFDYFDTYLETHIREDTFSIIIREIVNMWNSMKETFDLERLAKEEIDCIIFSEIIKETKSMHNLMLTKCQEDEVPFDGSFSQRTEVADDRHCRDLQYLLIPFTEFLQIFTDFEFMACERIRANTSRLEDLNRQLDPLVEQVNSIKGKELLYRKAFTRRCYDLQTAEAEVDLLGDQVDLLLSLIEKIYEALDHYSPVLQHYSGIMEILSLIKEQLDSEQKK
ncbi:uncharacterized protein LOC109707664 isoform X1 [Ananas comosus]|uniref:Uncharacterized protein LOC109707664 isoform X1 n=1 Tax=Ananas comosus TaxID=4615 RepID=A0A6P5EMJ2_ANACO|nr:uncharacterized protein LOC109707664 isoform X1 [Ananas comosus]XP_020084703.1 uncharacterized protein LOC109707664 isoform X1 [Ananas comosus]XP_020084704.1 uncharacterized protein LOC109707664 isoform X1 [Ananas comosus]